MLLFVEIRPGGKSSGGTSTLFKMEPQEASEGIPGR
jgi:hypothetical protein